MKSTSHRNDNNEILLTSDLNSNKFMTEIIFQNQKEKIKQLKELVNETEEMMKSRSSQNKKYK
jgi:hypothetical protein